MAAATKKRKRLQTGLAAAVAHPIRSKCLVILAERVASPAEIGRELNTDVATIGYHVNTLADAKLIEEVSNRPVRGAIEHFYRAMQLPVVHNEHESQRSDAERRTYAETILSIHAANAAHALEVGTLVRREDHHSTRLAFNLDEDGWKEAAEAHMELFERIFEIQETAAERMRESDEKPGRFISFQSLFEIPRTVK